MQIHETWKDSLRKNSVQQRQSKLGIHQVKIDQDIQLKT